MRRWWIIAIVTLLGTVAAFGYVSIQPKAYDSMTPVLVLAPAGDGTKVDLDTEAQIVPTAAVATGAQTLIGTTESITDLLKHVSVTVPPNTAILDITFEAPTRDAAQKGSQAFAQAYLDQRSAVATQQLKQQISNLQDNIDSLTKQLKTVAGQLVTLSNNSQTRAEAQQSQQILSAQIQAANQRLQPLEAVVIKPGSILSPASDPLKPAKPNVPLFLISGIALGLLLGLSAALLIARLDTRIYGAADVPERPDVPVLMEIRPGRQRPGVADAASPLGREFSLLRNVLRFAARSSRGGRPSTTDTLLVCGAVPGPAAGFVTVNLAAAFARSGERVAIVCTDPESNIPSILGISARYGLGEVLSGEIELAAALTAVPSLPGVTVLTSGQLDPRLELPVAAVADLLSPVQHGTDRVLIAASAPSSAVDAQALSEVAAAVLIVVEARRAHVPQVDAALDQFFRVYAPVAGLVVVRDHWKTRTEPNNPVDERVGGSARPLAQSVRADVADAPPASASASAVADKPASTSAPRQLRGWQQRTGDATVVLPKFIDVEDPPTEDWPKPDTLDALSLGDSSSADKR